MEQLAEEVAVLKQEKRQRELKMVNTTRADSATPTSNDDEKNLLDDKTTTPAIKQPSVNSGEDTDDTDVLSQEIA